MASNTFDINLVVFKNYICSFYIDFRFMFVMFPQLCQNLCYIVTYSRNCRGAVYIQRNRHRRGCDTGSDKRVGKSMSFKTIRTGSKHDFNGCCLGMLWGGVTDVITHAKFHLNRFSSFGSPRGRKSPFPIGLDNGSYNSVTH